MSFIKQAYYHGQQHALAEFGLAKMTKQAGSPFDSLARARDHFMNQPVQRYLGSALAGAGTGALADDDSALEGALLGAITGAGLHGLAGIGHGKGVTDMGPRTMYGAIPQGILGGLGGVGISNMIDDDDESILARLGVR